MYQIYIFPNPSASINVILNLCHAKIANKFSFLLNKLVYLLPWSNLHDGAYKMSASMSLRRRRAVYCVIYFTVCSRATILSLRYAATLKIVAYNMWTMSFVSKYTYYVLERGLQYQHDKYFMEEEFWKADFEHEKSSACGLLESKSYLRLSIKKF